MPAMVRPDDKAKKIAAKILGVNPVLQKKKKSKRLSAINRRLVFEETSRVR